MKAYAWLLASRPRTLPAAVVPVLVGSALAWSGGGFDFEPALLCMAFAVLIQIGTNFANDFYDWRQGADTEERKGPTRAVAAGLIPPQAMRTAAYGVLLLAFALGLLLVQWGGWWLVAVGAASVVSAVAYTARPFALGYRGLGDIFVVFFFGIVAVCITTYVQTGDFPLVGWPTGFAIGLLANNLLVVNNYRDRESDAEAGKRTLIVRFGPAFGEALILASIVTAGLLAFGFAFLDDRWLTLLALGGLIPIFGVWRRLPSALRREGFDVLLAQASLGMVLYGVLLSAGLLFAF